MCVMPKEVQTRKERTAKWKEHYLKREARRPHVHTHTLITSFQEDSETSSSLALNPVACPQCYPVLSHYSTIFKGMDGTPR